MIEHIIIDFKKLLIVPAVLAGLAFFPQAVMALEVTEPPVMKQDSFELVTIDNVNLRVGPSTDYEKLTTLPMGETVTVTFYNPDGFSQVSYDDYVGYIKSEFIGTQDELEVAIAEAHPVELTPWSEAKSVFTIGVPAEVYDVYSGQTYYVKSFSNGSHADVEPITAEDTAIMKRTFGGVWSWDVRPVWVTINGRTMAASINGMPHGGGVNSGNDMDGQVCIHFLGSTVHNGNTSFASLHQDILQEAYSIAN